MKIDQQIKDTVPVGYQSLSRLMIRWCKQLDELYSWNDAGMYNNEIAIRKEMLDDFLRAYKKDQKLVKKKI
jgi:hypothetical protein